MKKGCSFVKLECREEEISSTWRADVAIAPNGVVKSFLDSGKLCSSRNTFSLLNIFLFSSDFFLLSAIYEASMQKAWCITWQGFSSANFLNRQNASVPHYCLGETYRERYRDNCRTASGRKQETSSWAVCCYTACKRGELSFHALAFHFPPAIFLWTSRRSYCIMHTVIVKSKWQFLWHLRSIGSWRNRL